ncbi:MAG: tRNA (N6-isopentenyl adenosine(37)-C2)-methylthiotransferase MiaB, partial [Flammeovirgaceae bacterium]|nr:tRNA (N6-isopentenyl adenosine(37)-C2)-methylthiotransferase MiaB [Flammeovirgaceae bacterium]MDW8287917.1 tRNA (N6-isopentenyl adenosine(37)-C2)-methylthiotransferase MiaB [Flammeovirgaceae bacterium]
MDLIKDIEILDEQVRQACQMQVTKDNALPLQKRLYIESYGCQMNFSDSEIVASILAKEGYGTTSQVEDADIILLNTCSIREKAEQTVRHRLKHFQAIKTKNP